MRVFVADALDRIWIWQKHVELQGVEAIATKLDGFGEIVENIAILVVRVVQDIEEGGVVQEDAGDARWFGKGVFPLGIEAIHDVGASHHANAETSSQRFSAGVFEDVFHVADLRGVHEIRDTDEGKERGHGGLLCTLRRWYVSDYLRFCQSSGSSPNPLSPAMFWRMSDMFEHRALQLQEQKPIVFTALSKKYFYMRMHVARFVMESGKVPLNPFLAFDYFLADLVDRDLVRNANNNLVRIADELWVFGSISNGVFAEMKQVQAAGKPIRYFQIVDDRDFKEIALEEAVYEDGVEKFI